MSSTNANSYGIDIRNNGYIVTGNWNGAFDVGYNPFTFEVWACLLDCGSGNLANAKPSAGGSNSYSGWLVTVSRDGTFHFAIDNGFGYYNIDTKPTYALDGQWHHIAAVKTASDLVLYLDGEAVPLQRHTSSTSFGSIMSEGQAPITLGMGMTARFDEMRFWKEDRSAHLITDMYTRMSGSEANLNGCWSFDNKNLNDSTSKGNNAEGKNVSYLDVKQTVPNYIPCPTNAPTIIGTDYAGGYSTTPGPYQRWDHGYRVRYGLAFANGSIETGINWGDWSSNDNYFWPTLEIAGDPSGMADTRVVYRQFQGQDVERIARIAGTETSYIQDHGSVIYDKGTTLATTN